MKVHDRSLPSCGGHILASLLIGVGILLPSSARAQICAQVTIQIQQKAVVTRSAFEATLKITAASSPVESIKVDLDFTDLSGASANDKFGVPAPTLDQITAIDGTGTLPAGATGSAKWLLIPNEDAAPTADPVKYRIGGLLSHTIDGYLVEIPLYPVEIDVYPDAKLFLRYYLQSPVYSDNPFSLAIVEPAEPFSLGLLVRNEGFGPAKDLKITSSQPEIVNNEKGLLVAFKILGSQIGTKPIQPSLATSLGTIEPGGSAVARWLMTSTLQGEFVKYKADFEHVNGLGDPSLSLIKKVEIYELTHVVKLDQPEDDDLPDFLVGDGGADYNEGAVTNDPTELPKVIHSSTGAKLPLQVITQAQSDGPPVTGDLVVNMTVQPTGSGWMYLRIDDPSQGNYRLVGVERDKGPSGFESIAVGGPGDIVNCWTTQRWQPKNAAPQTLEAYLHLLDHVEQPGPILYVLTYAPDLDVSEITINDGLSQRHNVTNLKVEFTTGTNLGALISTGEIVDVVEVFERVAGGALGPKVTLPTSYYSWDPQAARLTIDLTKDGPGPEVRTLLSTGNYYLRMKPAAIKSVFGAQPLVDGDGTNDGFYYFGTKPEDGFYRLPGDATLLDRSVNQNDWLAARLAFGTTPGQPNYNPNVDLNFDMSINTIDSRIISTYLGNSLGF